MTFLVVWGKLKSHVLSNSSLMDSSSLEDILSVLMYCCRSGMSSEDAEDTVFVPEFLDFSPLIMLGSLVHLNTFGMLLS